MYLYASFHLPSCVKTAQRSLHTEGEAWIKCEYSKVVAQSRAFHDQKVNQKK